jgi:hypothetical protein
MAAECELVAVPMSIFHSNKCHSSSFVTQPLVVSSGEGIRMTLASSHDFHPTDNSEWWQKRESKKSALDNDYHNSSIFHARRNYNYLLLINCISFFFAIEC